MTELEKLQIELNSINWKIGEAEDDEARQELEDTRQGFNKSLHALKY